ncbi:MAG: hypothetical protein ACMUIA_09285, partial [bacterium]
MMTTGVEEQIEKAALFIRKQTAINPGIGLVLGTGMGKLAGHVEEASLIPYRHIPGFPPPICFCSTTRRRRAEPRSWWRQVQGWARL